MADNAGGSSRGFKVRCSPAPVRGRRSLEPTVRCSPTPRVMRRRKVIGRVFNVVSVFVFAILIVAGCSSSDTWPSSLSSSVPRPLSFH